MLRLFVLTCVLASAPLVARAEDSWTIYAGGYTTSWQTSGKHGHDVDCPFPVKGTWCEESDYDRANLDNSIGIRFGAERPFHHAGRLFLTHGAELTLTETEFNISQRDFLFGAMLGTLGAGVDLFGASITVRGGAGLGGTDDGRLGLATFAEASLDIPLDDAARFRLGIRDAVLTRSRGGPDPHSTDTSFLFVLSPDQGAESEWAYGTGLGLSIPGGLARNDLSLSLAPQWRLITRRRVRDASSIGVSYISGAHESRLKSTFMGYPGNERGRTINSIALDWLYETGGAERVHLDLALGVEAGDWADEHRLLVNPDDPLAEGIRLRSGGVARYLQARRDPLGDAVVNAETVEFAPAVRVAAHARVADALSLILSAEQVYWTGLGLGETRFVVGLLSGW